MCFLSYILSWRDTAARYDPRPATKPHIIMYGASWCRWCKKQVDELQHDTQDFTYDVRWCDVEGTSHMVTKVPTLQFGTTGGRLGKCIQGFHTTNEIREYLRKTT